MWFERIDLKLNTTKQTRLRELKQKTMSGTKKLVKDILVRYGEGSYFLEGQVKVVTLKNKTIWAEKSQVFLKVKQ